MLVYAWCYCDINAEYELAGNVDILSDSYFKVLCVIITFRPSYIRNLRKVPLRERVFIEFALRLMHATVVMDVFIISKCYPQLAYLIFT